MSAEARTRVYALVVVGEAVVILALATMLLLGFGEPDLGEFEQQLPAAGSGAGTPARILQIQRRSMRLRSLV